jgi:CBS domain-containing protein
MLRVRDIMNPMVLTLAAGDTTASAADTLTRAEISGAPVRDRNNNVVGVVSLADLANRELAGKRRHPTVDDVMTPDVLAVYEDDPALQAAVVMATHDIHRVLVWDAEGGVAGIVTSLDLVRALARGASFDVHAPDPVPPIESRPASHG